MSLLNSGLNDEVLSTLQPTDTFITPPSGDDGSLPGLVVQVGDPSPSTDVDALVAAMSQFDTQLETTEHGVTRLHDLDRVADTILATETIGRSDAEEVIRFLPALTDEVASAAEYTDIPTRTNLVATKAFVATAVADEKTAIWGRLTKIIEEEVSVLAPINLDVLVNGLVDDLEFLRVAALRDLAAVGVSKNFYAYREDEVECVDLRKYGFGNLGNITGRYKVAPKCVPVDNLARALNDALRYPDFAAFSNKRGSAFNRSERDLNNLSDPDRELSSAEWTYLDLLGYLAEGSASGKLIELMGVYVAGKALLADATAALDTVIGVDAKFQGVDATLPLVRTFTQQTIALLRICVAVRSVVTYGREVMDIFRKNV